MGTHGAPTPRRLSAAPLRLRASQESLVASLELALDAESPSPEMTQTLLNLAEFMEHNDKPLPIDIRKLGTLAEKCHAYAKALHCPNPNPNPNPNPKPNPNPNPNQVEEPDKWPRDRPLLVQQHQDVIALTPAASKAAAIAPALDPAKRRIDPRAPASSKACAAPA